MPVLTAHVKFKHLITFKYVTAKNKVFKSLVYSMCASATVRITQENVNSKSDILINYRGKSRPPNQTRAFMYVLTLTECSSIQP